MAGKNLVPSRNYTAPMCEFILRSVYFFDSFGQKVDFANNVQLSLTLAALSIGLWWTFDRSRSGFGLGISIALLATLTTQILVYNGVFQ